MTTPNKPEQEIGKPVIEPPTESLDDTQRPPGGETPTTFPHGTVEHQKYNGDQNTTGSGNYLKEVGLADYKKDSKPKEVPVIHPDHDGKEVEK